MMKSSSETPNRKTKMTRGGQMRKRAQETHSANTEPLPSHETHNAVPWSRCYSVHICMALFRHLLLGMVSFNTATDYGNPMRPLTAVVIHQRKKRPKRGARAAKVREVDDQNGKTSIATPPACCPNVQRERLLAFQPPCAAHVPLFF
jgi:hypothetical protein